MWAALLANAASPDYETTVRPTFIATLKQMAPDEARLVKWMWEREKTSDEGKIVFVDVDIEYAAGDPDLAATLGSCLDSLDSQFLVRKSFGIEVGTVYFKAQYGTYTLGDRTDDFIHACLAP